MRVGTRLAGIWRFATLLLAVFCGTSCGYDRLGPDAVEVVSDSRLGDQRSDAVKGDCDDRDSTEVTPLDQVHEPSDTEADQFSVPVGPLALSGFVRIEVDSMPPEGALVTASLGDQLFTTATNAEGQYEIRDVMMSGTYEIRAELPGYYAAQQAFLVERPVNYKVPDMTLRRWRLLSADSNPFVGQCMFNDSIVPYLTDISSNGKYGKLWLYDVATDSSTLVDDVGSISEDVLLEVPSSNLMLYASFTHNTKKLYTVYGYLVDKKQILFSFDRVSKPVPSTFMLGHGVHLVHYAPDVTPLMTNGRHLWVDPDSGAAQEFWAGDKWIQFVRKDGDLITFQADATAGLTDSVMQWDTKTQTLTELLNHIQYRYVWADSTLEELGVLYVSQPQAPGAPPQLWLLRSGDQSTQLVLDQSYSPAHFFSPDSQVLVAYGWDSDLCQYSASGECKLRLTLVEHEASAAVVALAQDVRPYTWVWGPASRLFLFQRNLPTGGAELVAFERSTGKVTSVSGALATGRFALHEPTGRVAYTVVGSGQQSMGELWLGDVHGGQPQLLSTGVLDEPVSFSPDGSAIAFRLAVTEGRATDGAAPLRVARLDDQGSLQPGVTCDNARPASSGWWSLDSQRFVAMCDVTSSTPATHSQTIMDVALEELSVLAPAIQQSAVYFGAGGSMLTNVCRTASDCDLMWWGAPAAEGTSGTLILKTSGAANVFSDSGQRWALATVFDSSTYGGESILVAVDTEQGIWHVLPGSVTDYRRIAGGWMLVFLAGWGQEEAFVLLDLDGSTILPVYGCPLLQSSDGNAERLVWAGSQSQPLGQCAGAPKDIHAFSSQTGQVWVVWSGLLQHMYTDSKLEYVTFHRNPLLGEITSRFWGSSTAADSDFVHLSSYLAYDFVRMAGNAALHYCRPPEGAGKPMLCVARIP